MEEPAFRILFPPPRQHGASSPRLVARDITFAEMSSRSTAARLASRLRLLMLAVAVVLVAVAALSNRATSRRGLHDETGEKCASNPIADPLDLQEKWQASLYGLGFLYICLGIAMVCEEYFVTALNELIEVNGISPDVAGATFMAAGSSSPEVPR